jgi:hypothetical protein
MSYEDEKPVPMVSAEGLLRGIGYMDDEMERSKEINPFLYQCWQEMKQKMLLQIHPSYFSKPKEE